MFILEEKNAIKSLKKMFTYEILWYSIYWWRVKFWF